MSSSLEISTTTLACITSENNYNQLINNCRNCQYNIDKIINIAEDIFKKIGYNDIEKILVQLENIEKNLDFNNNV